MEAALKRTLSNPDIPAGKKATLVAGPEAGTLTAEKAPELPPGALKARKHPELPAGAKLRLRPLVRVDDKEKIAGIQVCGRTPSPFGAAMGDHTVAWRALVDSIVAQMYGKSVPDAIVTLASLQRHAADWMADPDSAGMQLLNQLGADIIKRSERLEDAAARFEEYLASASAASRFGDPSKALLD